MKNFEEVVRRAGLRRGDDTPMPDPARWPKGWVHLSAAVGSVAEVLLDEVNGFEAAYALALSIGAPCETDDQKFAEEHASLTNHLAEQFIELCRCEFLKTGHRRIGGGGPVQQIPSDWWDTEDIHLRFRTWSIDPENEFNTRLDLPHWIWVEESSLKRTRDRIWRYRHNVENVTIVDGERLLRMTEALDVIAPFVPHLTDPQNSPIGPKGASELRNACAVGAVRALAGRMERRFDEVGLGETGKLIEAENDWDVPADLWNSIELSPVQNWASGTLLASPNHRNTIKLFNVMIDWRDLTSFLEGQKLLHRIQLRETGAQEPFAEAFTPTVAVEFREEQDLDGQVIRLHSESHEKKSHKPIQELSSPDWEKCQSLAAKLDAEGFPKRELKTSTIMERWTPDDGPPPGVDHIRSLMKGQPKGRPRTSE